MILSIVPKDSIGLMNAAGTNFPDMKALLPLLLVAASAFAQSEPVSQFSLYDVKPGMAREFELGYARHVQWHADARDPWAWYMWEVASGPRYGQYVGGMFDHARTELEQRPRPAEDGADHERNIDPYRASGHPRYLERRSDLGGTMFLLESTPYLVLFEIATKPSATPRSTSRTTPHAWYEAVNGDTHRTFLLFVPASRVTDVVSIRASDYLNLDADIERISSQLFRFRPDMSTCVLAATRCIGTVPAQSN
jgi:hypothetical protein